jgi:hypothetical protein
VVLVGLQDPAEADALIRDVDATLPRIPGVVAVHAGRHVDTGRPEVSTDYHVGLVLSFDSVASLKGYPTHPIHEELLSRWQPKVASLRVFDVEDSTP